jgi:hypothetical protein
MALQLFDLSTNCTRSTELYNQLYARSADATSLLEQVAHVDANLSSSDISSLLTDSDFVHQLSSRIGHDCRATLCTSLRFTGNADIAGIGVSLTTMEEELADGPGYHRIYSRVSNCCDNIPRWL